MLTVAELCNSVSAGVFLGTCYLQLVPYVEQKFRQVFAKAEINMAYCDVTAQCMIMAGFFMIVVIEQVAHAARRRRHVSGGCSLAAVVAARHMIVACSLAAVVTGRHALVACSLAAVIAGRHVLVACSLAAIIAGRHMIVGVPSRQSLPVVTCSWRVLSCR